MDDMQSGINEFNNICFLDILGFKNKLKQDDHNDCKKYGLKILNKIKFLGDVIQKELKTIEDKFPGSTNSLMVSDSIYIFFNNEVKEQILSVLALIYTYGVYQNLFYRGAISNKFMIKPDSGHHGLFLGDGIIDSYEMEGKLARYPRIITRVDFPDYTVIDNDGFKMIDIMKYIRTEYQLIKIKYNSYFKNLTLIKQCDFCDKPILESCKELIMPNQLPANLDEYIKEIELYLENQITENESNDYVKTKFFEMKKYVEGVSENE